MIAPPRFVEVFLALPLPLLGLVVILCWALVAMLVHRVLVPWIAGPDGRRLGKFEAEVAAQLGIVLGLLLSFNAVTVWEQSSAAREAVLTEASALREVHELLPELPAERQPALRHALRDYLRYLIHDEWPELSTGSISLDKPTALRKLSRLGRSGADGDLHESDLHAAVMAAASARDDRIRVATGRMLPARWTIVVILGVLALLSLGLVHAEHPKSRALAVGMVAFAIAACFVVLLVQARPFLGSLAMQPTELRELAAKVGAAAG